MEIAEEVLRMNRMLEVEDLAFRIQLQEAVSSFSLSPNFTGFVLLVLSMLPIQTKTFLPSLGLHRHEPDSW